jgi:two-component system, cell cycle sensor histidine kinase and response regulator CckA
MDLDHPEDLRRRLGEIGQASNRAKELVRQILTFSRQQPHERLRQHLQMIIREALGLLRASLPATIEICQDLVPEAPPVLADAGQIHQVVMNLCTNAAHAMGDRPGRLTVRLTPRTLDEAACLSRPGLKPGEYAHLTVADTGHGMEAAVLARVFEPFFTTKAPGEGTGLGLPMVHGIIKDHEGGIFVQSSPGAGTTFDLYFPAAPAAESEAQVLAAEIVPGQGESVLVVDDEEAIGQAVGAMLRRIGYHVEIYEDPREALACIRARPSEFDLLLTDRTMPQLSGPELIRRAREWWPSLPALLMSGMNSSNPQDEAAAQAGYALVEKPIDIADLSRTVRRALSSTRTS